MRKLAVFIAALALVVSPVTSGAETIHWATHAVATSQYSNNNATGITNPLFLVTGPVESAAFQLLGPIADPAVGYVLCTIFTGTPCLPEDLAGFVAAVLDAVAGLPAALAAILETFPGGLLAAIAALPAAIVDALTTTPNEVIYGPWAAMQATGEPNTYPACGDIPTAWAPQMSGTDPEALAVFYAEPVANATRIDIYETNIGGFVTSVEVVQPDGSAVEVFSGPDATLCPGILSIPLSGSPTVAAVVIHTQAPGWEEIDAVGVAA